MAQLQYKLRPNDTLEYNAKVYFACHPGDHKRYFDPVTDEILEVTGCAICYYAPGEVVVDEDYYLTLDQMRLVVIPVTARLLSSPSRVLDVDLPYALEHHIPVLPILQEPKLENAYREKFGNLQFLDKHQKDLTAVPYAEKLKKYLERRIQGVIYIPEDIFSAQIFLSYRKKDRLFASKLLQRIHKDPRCQDIAIWYDEFLKPGEDFSDSIRVELEKSNLFLMVQTPNLIEAQNYILCTEYPFAKSKGIPMLLAQMKPIETDDLQHALEPEGNPIPDCVDPYDGEMLIQAILAKLGDRRKPSTRDAVERLYYLAYAYRTGYFVEKNSSLAAELFRRAAEAGSYDAMLSLAIMYEGGEGVDRDLTEAIYWRKKRAEIARQCMEQTRDSISTRKYYRCLVDLQSVYKKAGEWASAEEVCCRLLQVIREDYPKAGIDDTASDIYFCYLSLGDIQWRQGNLHQAKEWYMRSLSMIQQIAPEKQDKEIKTLVVFFAIVGSDLLRAGHTADAKECLQYALEHISLLDEAKYEGLKGTIYGCLGQIDCNYSMMFRALNMFCKIIGQKIMDGLRSRFHRKK